MKADTHKPTHNDKNFLHPDSHRSMACYHAKVMEDDIMKLTIHDCRGSIHLHNDLSDPEQVSEALAKLQNLSIGIQGLMMFIVENYKIG